MQSPVLNWAKKSVKALRKEGKIPAVINGGAIVELPFNGTLKPVRNSLRSMTSAVSSQQTS